MQLLQMLLLKWIVTSNQPFLEVENSNFRDLIFYLNKNAETIGADTIRRDLLVTYNDMKLIKKKQFESLPGKYSLCIDAWTSPNQIPFLGITIHYFNNERKQVHELLEFKHLLGKHTGEMMGDAIIEILRDYFLNLSNIHSYTTDNALNNDTMFEHLSSHCESNGIPKAETNDKRTEDDERTITSVVGIGKTISQLRKLMKKLNYFHHYRESLVQLCEHFQIKKLAPIVDVTHRWNSTFNMIQRAEELKAPLNSICASEKTLESFLLTESQWNEIGEIA
ncbi:unnamed protein product [Allacma fusca]|uniref:Uncharacterized protein n=1 Tax=Allacma fusca TaxID=39272 RepID=A0A8J2LJE0_9HEXA|nr:unnamed protein product [Allacma fusca]